MAGMNAREMLGIAVAHHQAGRLAEAEGIYRQILAQQPNQPDALNLLGVLAGQVGQFEAAVVLIQQAIVLKPNVADYHNNLGKTFKDLGRFDQGIAACRRAIELKSNYAEAHGNLGLLLYEKGDLPPALAASEEALKHNFRHAPSHNNIGNVYKDQGRLDDAIAAYRKAVQFRPEFAGFHSNLVYMLLFQPDYDSQSILQEHRLWNQQHGWPVRSAAGFEKDTTSRRRLRIGYVSPYFRNHVVGRNLLPLFRERDRESFEIFCYADDVRPDATTEKLRGFAEHWISAQLMTDEQLSSQIRCDRIDILVDLSLHLAGNRLPVFARKPAPVQPAFAGYPGTTGLETMDYRLTDPYLDPPGQFDGDYSEKSIRLADSFWCYEPAANTPPVAPLPADSTGHITFGCLNNFCKINKNVLQLWSQVLAHLPDSHLLVLALPGPHRDRMAQRLGSLGISPRRVEFAGAEPLEKYLALYHRIDIGLDTFPYGGHTTSLDSYWMGVPVVTLIGQTVVGRAGYSQLSNLGLTELVAKTPRDYVNFACGLANDRDRLRILRAEYRERMRASPLMDARRFARSIENAYREMWRQWQA